MKNVIAVAMGFMVVASISSAEAKSKVKKQPVARAATSPNSKPKLSRNISFSGSAVDGKYHSAGEAVANVESEKSLNALMGIRKNFRDRLNAEQARLENGEGLKQ